MNALLLPQTDAERMQILNAVYAKGMNTPKNELAFSANMLAYVKPFIAKMQSLASDSEIASGDFSSVRQVVDELIQDILEEVQSASLRMGGKRGERLAADYGLNFAFNPFEAEFFHSKKVA
jgi:hypothetical protein